MMILNSVKKKIEIFFSLSHKGCLFGEIDTFNFDLFHCAFLKCLNIS